MKNIENFIEWLQKNSIKSFDNRKDLLKEIIKDEEWYLTIITSSSEKWRYKLNRKLSEQLNEWFRLAFNDFDDWDPEEIEEEWAELRLCPELKFLKQLWDRGWIKVDTALRDTCDDERYLAYIKFFVGDCEIQLERFDFADIDKSSIKDENFEEFFEENKEHLCKVDKWEWACKEAAIEAGVSIEDFENSPNKEGKLIEQVAKRFKIWEE